MDALSVARPVVLRLSLEVFGVFLVCLLLAGIRVSLREPVNPHREGRTDMVWQEAPGVNRYYDRPADETDFYVPVIRDMAARWPRIDLERDTYVEKPPGYPWLMATVAQVTGMDLGRLRGFHMLLSACVPGLLYLWLRRVLPALSAALLLAPLVFSSFLIKSSVYLGTDNPALLCTTLALMLLVQERASGWGMAIVMVGATAAASFRQDSLWLAAPIVVRLALAGPLADWRVAEGVAAMSRVQRVLLVGAVLLPVALVGRMVAEWGGLVPQAHVRTVDEPGASLMPVVYMLSVAALFGWPWIIARHGLGGAWRRARERPALAVGLAGVGLALVTNSQYGRELGHWGGYLWSLAAGLPSFGGRSPVFLALAPLGALALGVVGAELARARPAAALVLVSALGCWAAACCFNSLVFHRYYEVPLLVFLLLATGLLPRPALRVSVLRDNAPLLAVGAVQLLISVATLYLSLFASLRR